MMRYEERKIIPLSSGSFISANCKCCLKTMKYTHEGDYCSLVSQTGICRHPLGSADILWDLRECSFQGEVDRARKNSYKVVF